MAVNHCLTFNSRSGSVENCKKFEYVSKCIRKNHQVIQQNILTGGPLRVSLLLLRIRQSQQSPKTQFESLSSPHCVFGLCRKGEWMVSTSMVPTMKNTGREVWWSRGTLLVTLLRIYSKLKANWNSMATTAATFTIHEKNICKKTNRQIPPSLTHTFEHRHTHFYVGKGVHSSKKSMHLKLCTRKMHHSWSNLSQNRQTKW